MPTDDGATLALAGGHVLEIVPTAAGNEVRLTSPGGGAALVIEVSAAGIRIQLDGPSLAIRAARDLSISAENLVLEGRSGLSIRSEGGSVDLKASDDVKMSGERVMVNCDETVDAYYRRPPR